MLVIRILIGCKRRTRNRKIRNREYGIGKHGIGEYGIGKHGIDEYGIGKHKICAMLRHH